MTVDADRRDPRDRRTTPSPQWLAGHVDGCTPPFGFDLIAAGGSNLTYRVTDAGGHTWALRRPPVTAVLATAHDMGREWRIIEALGAHTDVPVPAAIARCDDVEVTGGPFYVMGFVDGLILRDEARGATLSRRRVSRSRPTRCRRAARRSTPSTSTRSASAISPATGPATSSASSTGG